MKRSLASTLFILVLTTLPIKLHAASEKEQWNKLQDTWASYQRERRLLVDRLHMQVSEKEFTKSSRYKFLLKDNLGDAWLFKAGNQQVDGAKAIDQLNLLGGIPTVPFFEYTVELNGRKTPGSIQQFTPNKGTFDDISISEISSEGSQNLAQHHLISWLTMNHHVHSRQFIIAPGYDSANKLKGPVYRIDNSVDFYLMDHERIDIDYVSPLLSDMPGAGYISFFRHFLRKNLSIDLPKLMTLAEFYRKMPEEFYLSFFPSIKDGEILGLSGVSPDIFSMIVPEITTLPKSEAFRAHLLKRKDDISFDLLRFYKNLIELRGEKWKKPEIQLVSFLEERIKDLESQTTQWRGLNQRIIAKNGSEAVAPLQKLEILGSYRAHLIYGETLVTFPFNPRDIQINKFDEAIKKLEVLEASETNSREKSGIRNAKQTLTKIAEQYRHHGLKSIQQIKWMRLNANKLRSPPLAPKTEMPKSR